MSEHSPGKPDTSIAYEVQYQDTDSKPDDWYVMDGRDHDKNYWHQTEHNLSSETSSMDEAVDTAEALATKRAFPKDPGSRHYRRVLRSRVIVRIYTGHVAAVYEAH